LEATDANIMTAESVRDEGYYGLLHSLAAAPPAAGTDPDGMLSCLLNDYEVDVNEQTSAGLTAAWLAARHDTVSLWLRCHILLLGSPTWARFDNAHDTLTIYTSHTHAQCRLSRTLRY
jgi:hypothetical protein